MVDELAEWAVGPLQGCWLWPEVARRGQGKPSFIKQLRGLEEKEQRLAVRNLQLWAKNRPGRKAEA